MEQLLHVLPANKDIIVPMPRRQSALLGTTVRPAPKDLQVAPLKLTIPALSKLALQPALLVQLGMHALMQG